MTNILTVDDACVYFPIYHGVLKKLSGVIKAVDKVNLTIEKEETYGIIGETGSGKTTLAKAIIGIQDLNSGKILYHGQDLIGWRKKERKMLCRKIQYIYQDPSSSLDPRKSVKDILIEPLKIHNLYPKEERMEIIGKILNSVDLPSEDFMNRYMTNLSGGQKQRVAIARCLLLQPDLLVLDEPTSALDVSVQAKILELLDELKKKLNLTYLIITHDLSVISNMTQKISILYLGHVMEEGKTVDFFKNPLHPYTKLLLASIPLISESEEIYRPSNRTEMIGEIPSFINLPTGCRFNTRCPFAMEICKKVEPKMIEIEKEHFVACHLY